MISTEDYLRLSENLANQGVILVAVSKTHPPEVIRKLYALGHRIFGENRVQELLEKQPVLPSDIQWHVIGHLQTNKVKQIVPFVSMIESVDSLRLLRIINKEALRIGRTVDVLLQIKIAEEDTKFGWDPGLVLDEVREALTEGLPGVRICGVMGMASFVDDEVQVRREFQSLRQYFERIRQEIFPDSEAFNQISMGMSGDYTLAVKEGSTMVRIGSLLFGAR